MVLLTATTEILEAISSLPSSLLEALKDGTTDPLPEKVGSPISHKSIIALARIWRSVREAKDSRGGTPAQPDPVEVRRSERWTLNKLLRQSIPYIHPPPPKSAPTPEFTALMDRLRAEAERKEYYKLVSSSQHEHEHKGKDRTNALGQANDDDDDNKEEDPITPSVVTNIFLSIIMCGFAVFQASRWWHNEAMRVLLSLAAAIIVGVAEVVVYAAYVRNVKRGRRKERMRREKKVFLGQYTGDKSDVVYDGTGKRVDIDRANGDDVDDSGRHSDNAQRVSTDSVVEDDGNDNDNDNGAIHQVTAIEKEIIWGRGKHGGMRRRVREKWEKEQSSKQMEVAG